MKTCLCCGCDCLDEPATCPECGEASWLYKRNPNPAPKPKPAKKRPKKAKAGD